MSENTEFNDFVARFGKLMERGLNSLPPSTRKMVADTIAGGGELYTIVTPEPPTLSAMLSHNGQAVELFQVSESVTWN